MDQGVKGFPGERKEFAVNLNTPESILTRIAPEKINEVLHKPKTSVTIVNDPRKLSQLIRKTRHGVELWGKLLILALLFFIQIMAASPGLNNSPIPL